MESWQLPVLLVEAELPINNPNPGEMLRCLLGYRVGGEERLKSITISPDKTRALVQFNTHPELRELLSQPLMDPTTQRLLHCRQVDLSSLGLLITGFPPFVNEDTLKSHFEQSSNGQQVISVVLNTEKTKAIVKFSDPAVMVCLAGFNSQMFGSELQVTLDCADRDDQQELFVWGLPASVPAEVLPDALKHYFLQCTGCEVSRCTLTEGGAYVAFTRPGVVRELVKSPPSQPFTSGCYLQFSLEQPRHNWKPYTSPVPVRPIPKPRKRNNSGQNVAPSGDHKEWTNVQGNQWSSSAQGNNSGQNVAPSGDHKEWTNVQGNQWTSSAQGNNSGQNVAPSGDHKVWTNVQGNQWTSSAQGWSSQSMSPLRRGLNSEQLYHLQYSLPILNQRLTSLAGAAILQQNDIVIQPVGSVSGNWGNIVGSCLDDYLATIVYSYRTINCRPLLVKYVAKFCSQDLDTLAPDVKDVQFDFSGSISAKVTAKGEVELSAAPDLANTAQEKTLSISATNYTLLSADRGVRRIEQLLSDYTSDIVYSVEKKELPSGVVHTVAFLSRKSEPVKDAKKTLRAFLCDETRELSRAKLALCRGAEWQEKVATLTQENFVEVSVESDERLLIVAGDVDMAGAVADQLCSFLARNTESEIVVTIGAVEWKVMEKNMSDEIKLISTEAGDHGVTVNWPQQTDQLSLNILLSGEKAALKNVEEQVQKLCKSVCCREERVEGIASASLVLDSMKDSVAVMEEREKVAIRVSLEGSKAQDPQTKDPVAGATKTLAGNLSSFISLIQGNLLEQKADVYVNSTNNNLDLKQGQLSNLLLKKCGDSLQQQASEYAPLQPGEMAVTDANNLPCQHIFHVVLPPFKTARSERVFRKAVKTVLCVAKDMKLSSIAFPSLGVANLEYPAQISARIMLSEAMSFHAQFPNSIQKFVFVIYEKSVFKEFSKEFAELMSDSTQPQASPTTSMSPGPAKSTLLTIAQGNIADEKTDIIVNTTTETMVLERTAVSRALLQKAGSQLQMMCQQLVDNGMKLDHGNVVITPACGGLGCRYLLHAHIPHKGSPSLRSESHGGLIEKIVTDCLQRAEEKKLRSITFPAFGLGGGGYSIAEVAGPMLKALKSFGQSNPQSIDTIRVVIYDQELHKQFLAFHDQFFQCDSPCPTTSFWSRITGWGKKDPKGYDLQSASLSENITAGCPAPTTVIFRIFAASDLKCEAVAKKLRELISGKTTTSVLNESVIEHLIGDDCEEIMRVGASHAVDVKILHNTSEIHISGEKYKVTVVYSEVNKVLQEMEKCLIELRDYQWQSVDPADSATEDYSPEASVRLERAQKKNLHAIEMSIDGVAVVIDLHKMTETDKATGHIRNIQRVKKSREFDGYPDTWTTVEGSKEYLVDVDPGSSVFLETAKELNESLQKYTPKVTAQIERLQRIENRIEYQKHFTNEVTVCRKYGTKQVLVKTLYHGSKQESVEMIAVQGFNRSFAKGANAAYFGNGVYFAVEPAYSAQEKYSKPDSNGLQYMFKCRVIVGKYTLGKEGMKAAPPLEKDGKELYDSLVDNVNKPTIFVAMSDAQAYPEYLITFKKIKKK